jgi:hypothetical protein
VSEDEIQSDAAAQKSDPPAVQEEPPEFEAIPAPPRLRVGWVAGTRTLDALGRVFQPLAIGLMDELVSITTFCPRNAITQELPCPPVELVPHSPLRWWSPRHGTIDMLCGEVVSRKIQLLHALDTGVCELTRKLAAATGLNYLLSVYSPSDAAGIRSLDAAVVLATCDRIHKAFVDSRKVPAARTYLLRPGVYQVRHATCFTQPDCSVSVVAGGPEGDFEAFVSAMKSFAQLRESRQDCVFFVMGSGRAEKKLRTLAERLNLRREVVFVDRPPSHQLPAIFQGADIYVSPSRTPAFDVQSLLAMAAGVPVITERESASDFVIEGKTALCFRAGDSTELTQRLSSLLSDHAAARELAENALEHLRKFHSPAGMVASIAQVYRRWALPGPTG